MDKTFFDLAREAVEARQQWPGGHSETIWQGKVCKVTVSEGGRDGGGLLFLGFFNGKPGQEAVALCGYLNPLEGWRFSLDPYAYKLWSQECAKALKRKINGR